MPVYHRIRDTLWKTYKTDLLEDTSVCVNSVAAVLLVRDFTGSCDGKPVDCQHT